MIPPSTRATEVAYFLDFFALLAQFANSSMPFSNLSQSTWSNFLSFAGTTNRLHYACERNPIRVCVVDFLRVQLTSVPVINAGIAVGGAVQRSPRSRTVAIAVREHLHVGALVFVQRPTKGDALASTKQIQHVYDYILGIVVMQTEVNCPWH
jgi:hypothetical protein